MHPTSQANLTGHALQDGRESSSVSLSAPALRYSWRVKDCLICAWYELPGPLSIDEMWRLLVEGRYCDARRLE